MTTRRAILWGAAAASLYLASAAVSAGMRLVPVLPLLDGLAPPPPYRWVDPPPERREDNEPPEEGSGRIELENGESKPASIGTPDAQASVVFPFKAVAPRDGETAVGVRIAPLDPDGVAPPPSGLLFDGNAYRITATYETSGEPTVLTMPVQLVLRYATAGETVLERRGAAWGRLRASPYHGSLLLTADAEGLGTFVPAAKGTRARAIPWWAYVAAGVALAVAVGGLLIARGRQRRRRARRDKRRA